VASNLVEKARQGAVVAQVKAALMDRKDIRSRYIRVRYDGKRIQLAGFVKDAKQGKQVAEIAKQQEASASVVTFWSYEKDLEDRDPYKTHVGEQASDAEIWVKVRAALCSPAAKTILQHADVQAVDVRHGKVRVFLIVDGPPEDIDLSPHIKPIHGVTEFSCRTVKTGDAESDTTK
jgi:osmotically-inducible protein OsmY